MPRPERRLRLSIQTFCLCLLALVVSTACGSGGAYVWVWDLPRTPKTVEPLQPGDRIQVSVYGQDAMSGEFEIRPEGDVVLPSAGRVQAANLTPERLAVDITTRLRGILEDPRVTVIVASRRAVSVGVLGEVRTPGRYDLRSNEGVLDALARAGGLTPFADPDEVFVIRKTPTQRIRFRYSELTRADPASVAFQLHDGDIVVVE